MIMKGLLIKDYYCLKKSLKSFLALTIGVILIGIMFAISMEHGNMKIAAAETAVQSGVDEATAFDMFRVAVWLVIIIPMAFVGNVVDCFKADMRADFGKQLFSLPVSSKQIVAARYLTCIIYALVSFVGATITAICISGASEQYPFSELMSVTVLFGSVMMIYLCIVMCLIYLIGVKYADYIQSAPLLIVMIIAMVFSNVKMMNMSEAELDSLMENMWGTVKGFITQNVGVFMLVAVVILVITYFASVQIVEKRRGKAIC